MTKTRSESAPVSATVSVKEARQRLGPDKIGIHALYRALNRGDIPSIRVGRKHLIPVAWLNRQLQGNVQRK